MIGLDNSVLFHLGGLLTATGSGVLIGRLIYYMFSDEYRLKNDSCRNSIRDIMGDVAATSNEVPYPSLSEVLTPSKDEPSIQAESSRPIPVKA